MKRKKNARAIVAVGVSVLMMVTTLVGCTGKDTSAGSSEPSAVESVTGRQDGERFEAVIQMEGMDETVRYEHVRNETVGYELDYDYELLERRGTPDHEQFVSRLDDPEKPDNYIELTFRKGDEETVTASVKTELSQKYKQVEAEQQFRLDSAGECTRIVTSGARKNKALHDSLMTVYIIPAAGGCLVASVHCTVESAEGFGVRLNCIANTIFVPGK